MATLGYSMGMNKNGNGHPAGCQCPCCGNMVKIMRGTTVPEGTVIIVTGNPPGPDSY